MRQSIILTIIFALCLSSISMAACRDAVVLVHGNAGFPANWDNTYAELLERGYQANEIFRPNWGSKTCPACNNHQGSEETPIVNALNQALNRSCTGNIDIIAHSMGVTLAGKKVLDLNIANRVNTFVAIAGAFRGLRTCGTYPFNVFTSTCGAQGLSINSPLLNSLNGKRFAKEVFSIKSWSDQINCATGICTVGGIHTSQLNPEDGSFSFPYGHFGLQLYTEDKQVDLIL